MAEQLAQAWRALHRNPRDLPDFSTKTLSGTIPSESTVIPLLCQLVKGLVTIRHELSRVTHKLEAISAENDTLREEVKDISSQMANPAPT